MILGVHYSYWEYPKISNQYFANHLQQREIAYSQKNNSPYTIKINSTHNHDKYSINVQIMSNSKLLSSLRITDRLPYQSSINTRELDNFDLRVEYLLRHNIWNGLLFLSTIYSNIDNSSVINDFLKKSIKSSSKNTNWGVSTLDFNSTLLSESEKLECSSSPRGDYKDYPFSTWVAMNHYSGVKVVPETNYIFDINNTIHTIKDHSTLKNPWVNNSFAYSIDDSIYIFFTFGSWQQNISVLKFTKKGQFVNQYNIHLPQNMILEGRDWHPISNIEFIDNKMRFRVYNIYESKTNSEAAAPIKDQCSFNQLEIQLP